MIGLFCTWKNCVGCKRESITPFMVLDKIVYFAVKYCIADDELINPIILCKYYRALV